MNRDKFIAEIRAITFNSRQKPADIIITVATMLVATRLCQFPEGGGKPGFLDEGSELTNAGWRATLQMLDGRYYGHYSEGSNPFELAQKTPALPPGVLENLRRLVTAALWEATARRHYVSLWLSQAVLDLANAQQSARGASPVPRLISDIIGPEKKGRVYCGYDWAAEIAIQLATDGMEVSLDLQSQELAAICTCIALAAELPLQLRCGDPVELAQDDDRYYDISIVVPPFNHRYRKAEIDGLRTGLPAPANSESVGVALALARGREIAMCLVPASFLFQASKANQVFKEYAISDYGLDTVVSLSAGLAFSLPLSTGLLIFRPKSLRERGSHNVFMTVARGERARAGGEFGLPEDLGEAIRGHKIMASSALVPISDIAANDFVLLPERFMPNPETERLRELEAEATFVPLDELVEITRPQAIRALKESEPATVTYTEVAVADIDDVGLVRCPTKQVPVAREAVIQARRALLAAGDIILVIKGSIGKLGFIRKADLSEANWIANQSFVILRLRPHAPIQDPRFLFRYLSSSLGQGMIQSLRVGTGVPGLQMAGVRRLSIAVLPLIEQTKICRYVDEMFEIQDKIEDLRKKLAESQHEIWPGISNS